jgi:hypothetical protein
MARFKTYARKCDITGEGMNEGFCICDGEMYIKYEKDLIAHLRAIESEKQVTDEWLKEDYHKAEYYYWTEWDDKDHQYAVAGDKLIEIEYI